MGQAPQKLLVWDFDGTLAHRDETWGELLAQALNRVSSSHGVTERELLPHLQTGFPWHDHALTGAAVQSPDAWWLALEPVFVRACVACGIDDDAARRAAREVRGVFVNPSAWRLYDDVLPALAAAQHAGWTQVILSNNVPELPEIVAGLGLGGYIERVFTSAALLGEKPNGVVFRAVLAEYPMAMPAVMVGDNPIADVEGARAAGMHAILARAERPGDDAIVTLGELQNRLPLAPDLPNGR
jgi:putative hydrolase of the HAD superfamily